MPSTQLDKLAINGQGGHPAWYAGAVLWLLALQLIGAAGFAASVNPRAEFPSDLFAQTVQDELRLKVDAFRQLPAPPGTVVIGTSRSAGLPVGPGDFNFASSGGSLQDDQATWDHLQRTGRVPQRLVIGLDSFQLDARDHARAAYELSGAASDLTGEGRSLGHWIRLAMGTLSVPYQMDAFETVRRALHQEPAPSTVSYAPNGVLVRTLADAQRANGTYDFDARFESHWRNFMLGHYPEDARSDADAEAAVVRLVRQANAVGVEVQVFLTPFHPKALERLSPNPGFQDLHAGSLRVLQSVCAEGAQAYDFTEIATFGGRPDGFYDSYHMTPENAHQVLATLDARVGNLCDVPEPAP